ncbi:MAG: glucose-1-phosphate adenylyltransferase, partial [Verrucomicrobia bacterium]|nr:glucose-1-phosphate adenylyltransferase [Verrucomicrobiota bacterium]
YRMDFRLLMDQHAETGAEVTIAVLPVRRRAASSLGILQVAPDKRIVRFVEKPKDEKLLDELKIHEPLHSQLHLGGGGDHYLASMGIYLFNREVLIKELDNEKADFGKHIIPDAIARREVRAYIFNGFWEDIGTVRSFFETHLALTKPKPPFDFHDPHAPVYTAPRFLPASTIHESRIHESLLGQGCVLDAVVIHHSVIGLRSRIGKGSKLREVVMMGADYYEDEQQLHEDQITGAPRIGIGQNCVIERAILDKNVRIGDRVHITPHGKSENADHALYCIRDGIVCIPKNSIIPTGTAI